MGLWIALGVSPMAEDFEMVAEAMLMAYAESVNTADADGLAELFWLEDERCSGVADTGAEPLGRVAFRALLSESLISGEPGEHMVWHQARAHRLSSEAGYVTAMQHRGNAWQRVTLILLKKGHEWGILHMHASPAATST